MKEANNTNYISNRSIMSDGYDRSGSGCENCLRDAVYTDEHTVVKEVQMSIDNFIPLRIRLNGPGTEPKINVEESIENGGYVTAGINIQSFYSSNSVDLEASKEAVAAMCMGSHSENLSQFVLRSRKTSFQYDWVALSNSFTKTYCSYFKTRIPADVRELRYQMKTLYEINDKPGYMLLRTDKARQAKLIALYAKEPQFNYKIVPILQKLISVSEYKSEFIVKRYKFCQAYAEIIFTYKTNELTQRFVEGDRYCIPVFKLYLNYGSGERSSYIESGIWFTVNGTSNWYYEPEAESSVTISNNTDWHEVINTMTNQMDRKVEETRTRQRKSVAIDVDEIRHYVDNHLEYIANKIVDRRALKAVDKYTEFTHYTVLRVLEVIEARKITDKIDIYTINAELFRCLEEALNTYKATHGKNKSANDLFDHVLSKIFL